MPAIAFSADGRLLAAAQSNGTVRVWEADGWRPLASPLTTRGNLGTLTDVMSVGFSSDGSFLAAGGDDGSIHVWGLKSAEFHALDPPLSGHSNPVHVVAFKPNSRTLASASYDQTVRLWDVSTEIQGESMESRLVAPGAATFADVFGIAFSPDGHQFAAGYCGGQSTGSAVIDCERGSVATWDMTTHQRVGVQLPGPVAEDDHSRRQSMSSVAYSPDGSMLAAGDFGGAVYLWDTTDRRFLGPLPREPGAGQVLALVFSPDGALLAASEMNGQIALWDVPTRQPLPSLVGPVQGLSGLTFSPDGQLLAVGGADGAVHFWDAHSREPSGPPLQGPSGPTDRVLNGIAFSRDGQLLAGAGGDGLLYVWEMSTRQPVVPAFHFPLGYRREALHGVAFSPDGRLLATYASSAGLLLWDVATRQPWNVLSPSESLASVSPYTLAFSPDGTLVAAGTSVWDISLSTWESRACHVAGRNLTHVEWNSYIGEDTAYHRTCADLPEGRAPSE
jgi:WD40 repeat protein